MNSKEKKSLLKLEDEDQFFFGLVITLLILVLQLPKYNVEQVFLNFNLTTTSGISGMNTIGINTQMVMIIFLMVSSGFRYYTALETEENKKCKWRFCSVIFLLSCVYFEILALMLGGVASLLSSINVYLVFLIPFLFAAVAILIGYTVELKWVRFYGYNDPFAAIVFATVGFIAVVGSYVNRLFPWVNSSSLKTTLDDYLTKLALFVVIFIVAIVVGVLIYALIESLIDKTEKGKQHLV
jgi:cytochrome bd-type quinol oxidase subunit 2